MVSFTGWGVQTYNLSTYDRQVIYIYIYKNISYTVFVFCISNRFCEQVTAQLSHEQKPSYFPWNTGGLTGILIMVYYNPHITG